MYEILIQEVREELAKHDWKLYLYSKLSKLKKYNCTGLCDEESKRLLIATKQLPQHGVVWFLAHEYAHFKQIKSFRDYHPKTVEKAYRHYGAFADEKVALSEPDWRLAREIVIEYEYNADQLGYEWLEDHEVRREGYIREANAYSYIIRYAFYDGIFLSSGRSKVMKEFGLKDEWASKKERQRKLNPEEIDYLRYLAKKRNLL